MARFAANLSLLFTDVPVQERIARAVKAGFDAVEIQFPYEIPAAELRAALDESGTVMVLHNLPAGDWAGGDRGIACDPARRAEFLDGIALAVEYAKALGVQQLNCLSGRAAAGVSEPDTRKTFVDNVGLAAEVLGAAGLRLLIEPVNSLDVDGFWLDSVTKALSVMEEIGSDATALQFDIYHAHRSGGDVAALIEQNLHQIGHVQFADSPGRHEPGTGELDFGYLFGHLDRLGYHGWIGAEYIPAGKTEAGLSWLKRYGERP